MKNMLEINYKKLHSQTVNTNCEILWSKPKNDHFYLTIFQHSKGLYIRYERHYFHSIFKSFCNT